MIADNPAVLSVRKLVKNFRNVEAVRGIDITLIKPGVYGFLGPNGAGKTTTFKLISGLLKPTSGTIEICGLDVGADSSRAMSELGILFDSPAYYPYLTGRENLEVFARWIGRDLSDRIGELLEMVGLSKAYSRKTGEYSWGMKRRLGIAAALLSDPKLLIMDEPTNGLDPAGIADIRRLLPDLAYGQGRVVLLSSHRMEEVDQICDQIMIINEGEIVASGSRSELSSSKPVVEVVCDDAAQAISLLSKIQGIDGIEQTGPGRIRLLAPGLPAAAVNSVLVENGITVNQVMEMVESLEDIFFRLTGNKNDEE